MTIHRTDAALLAHRIEIFVDLVQDPQKYFKRHCDAILPESLDHQLIGAALFLLCDCYLRGKGLKHHPSSKTRAAFRDALIEIWDLINAEVDDRPYLYPKLSGVIGRATAAVQLDMILEGTSRWAEKS